MRWGWEGWSQGQNTENTVDFNLVSRGKVLMVCGLQKDESSCSMESRLEEGMWETGYCGGNSREWMDSRDVQEVGLASLGD